MWRQRIVTRDSPADDDVVAAGEPVLSKDEFRVKKWLELPRDATRTVGWRLSQTHHTKIPRRLRNRNLPSSKSYWKVGDDAVAVDHSSWRSRKNHNLQQSQS
mmetsp:Transcript_1391/g.2737  ORF Transcript_1391/g.2737 Transcript_1391/m.2737 type:complete len:102 (-) Transcript_1391:207-512(-)